MYYGKLQYFTLFQSFFYGESSLLNWVFKTFNNKTDF